MSWRSKLHIGCPGNDDRSDKSGTSVTSVTTPVDAQISVSPDVAIEANTPDIDRGPESGIDWAEWKAAALNHLFRAQGVTGQTGRITAATIRHGQAGRARKSGGVSTVDCVATHEQPMSRAETTE
jgi:hypothetical protein